MHDVFGQALGMIVLGVTALIMFAMLGVSAWGLSGKNRLAA
ncbi:hypothetical protein AKJ09_04404 [Labilithrix luteola]|uniref:Uncharacterized protein n=1 Tax=Labilithrix luteola TaxID=1391654 RepID=A0A0K1PW48_9BACT|nr:hypothetical protein [Labilithrix luteola]AKU97740.1 hypothetical protein AKJ09_04404 [Labilithrix luteola]